MKKLLLGFLFTLLIGCSEKNPDEKDMIFIVIPKATNTDGLYLNLLDPNIFYLQDACGVRRTFTEINKKDRLTIKYSEARKLYNDRYKESFFTLLPSDFNKQENDKIYKIVAIDTINRKAFRSQIIDASIIN